MKHSDRKSLEDCEIITNYELVQSVHALMGNIDLDVASSRVANEYVRADKYYSPSDDSLNSQPWYGKVYLFPPNGIYCWDELTRRWNKGKTKSKVFTSSHAVWFRRLFREWWKGNIDQAVYMTNHPDMIRYDQRIFDFPLCIPKKAPMCIKNTSRGIETGHDTSTSIIVYMPPRDYDPSHIERFLDIYSEKGRILC